MFSETVDVKKVMVFFLLTGDDDSLEKGFWRI